MRKAIKPILKIIALTIIVLAAIFYVNGKLKELGNEISGKLLVDLIKEQSNGLYELSFEKLDLNVIGKTVRLYNARLTTNYQSITDSSTISNLYEVSIESADIELKSVIKIYTKNELVVKGVEVVNPQILMTKINPEKKDIKFGRETGELYEIIADYLDLLQIDYFQVRGGGIHHNPSQLSLNSINFGVKDFTVDSENKKRKVFYSESINLGLSNQSIDLPDSIHVLTFEGFKLSTKDSILSFSNLEIKAKPGIDKNKSFTEDRNNIYHIIIPLLELKGINYLKAYEDNHLLIDKVIIPKPIINIQSVSAGDSSSNTSDNTIGKSLLALFDLIKVKNLEIDEAAFDLVVRIKNQQQFKSQNISIELFDIQLDSTNYQINSRTNYFENAKISIRNYDYKLPDSLHLMTFKNLSINTFNSDLLVEDFIIKPSRTNKDSTLNKYNFNIPLIKLEGVNYMEALIDKQMFLKSMEFKNPVIFIDPARSLSRAENDSVFTARKLQTVLKTYFEEIKADQIILSNGTVEIEEQFYLDEINLDLDGLVIDTAVRSWHNLADSLFLEARHFQLKMKTADLKINSIKAGKNLHNFELEDFTYSSLTSNDIVESFRINIAGVQLDSIIESSRIQIQNISLYQPKIKLHRRASGKKAATGANTGLKWPENAITINIIEGNLKYHFDSANNLKIDKFNAGLAYQKEFRLDFLLTEGVSLKYLELEHDLSIERLKLTKNSNTLTAYDITALPLEAKSSVKLTANIPLLQLTDFNREKLIKENKLSADSLIVNVANADFQWLNKVGDKIIKGEKKSKKEKENFTFDINTAQIKIKGSTLKLENEKNEVSNWQNRETSLTLKDLSYPKDKSPSVFSGVYVKDFVVENVYTKNVSFSGNTLILKNTFYNSKNKKGEIENFSFEKRDKSSRANILNVKINNWDAFKYVATNELHFGSVLSSKTDLFLTIKNSDEKAFKNQHFLPFKKVKIDQLTSKNINLNVFHEEKDRNFHVRQANLKINSVNLDSTIFIKSLHKNIASLSFNGKDYKEDIGDNYTINAGNYAFSYPKSTLSAYDIKVKSRYDRFKFSEHIKYQTDWFDLKFASLKLSGIDIDKLINEELYVEKATVEKAEFTVLRDLNVPLDTTKYVPLPQESLRKVNYPFKIDTISVSADIKVFILPKDGGGLGVISFNELEGAIYGLSSLPSKHTLHLIAEGKLNNSGDFWAAAEFPFPSKKSEFTLRGYVGPMDISTLNDMLIPIAAVEVRSGINEELTFNLKGNNDYAKGAMSFRYSKLKVNILDRKTYKSSGLSNSLRTFFANSFVVRGRNPNFFKLNEGVIFFERNKSRSVFNFWSKSLLSGAVSSIGISKNEGEAEEYEEEGID